MKIVVFGRADRVDNKLAETLTGLGHDVSGHPDAGISSPLNESLEKLLSGADVVVDVTSSPCVEDNSAPKLAGIWDQDLLAAGATVGIRHHVALSIVGADRHEECHYFRARLAQEKRIKASNIPHTILRATQSFEWIASIVDALVGEQIVRMSPALFQPVALDDVVGALVNISLSVPVNGVVELAGPERISVDEFARKYLNARKDARKVMADIHAQLFGMELDDRSLTPSRAARLGSTCLERWLTLSARDTR